MLEFFASVWLFVQIVPVLVFGGILLVFGIVFYYEKVLKFLKRRGSK